MNGRGEVFEGEDIQFENVPIVTPNGDVLLKSLTFNVKPGVTISPSMINLSDCTRRRNTCLLLVQTVDGFISV